MHSAFLAIAVPALLSVCVFASAHASVSQTQTPQTTVKTTQVENRQQPWIIPQGTHLSDGIALYAAHYGWQTSWELPIDYVLSADLPVPTTSLRDGLDYILRAYRSQGGLLHATIVLAAPNHQVVVRPTVAARGHS